MMPLPRHTLCWLESSALEPLAKTLEETFHSLPPALQRAACEYLLSGSLPGIVRRGVHAAGTIPLGFCFPLRWQGNRLRLAVEVPETAVIRYAAPEQTASMPVGDSTGATRAFNALRQSWRWPELRLGVWGSVALEIVTPWLWTDSHSDLDILLVPHSFNKLAQCQETLCKLEQQYQLRIDGEIHLSNGYAINIKEWFSGSSTLLAKSNIDVRLMTRQSVVELSKTSIH